MTSGSFRTASMVSRSACHVAWDTLVNPGMLHCLSTGMTAFCRHGASVAGVLCTVQSCSEACAADAQLHAPLDRGRHIIYTTQCLAPTQLVESMDTLSNAQTWGLMVVRRSCASLNSLLVTEVRALVMQGSSRLQLSCGRRAQQSRRPSMCSRGRARWQRGRMRTSSYWTPRPGTPSAASTHHSRIDTNIYEGREVTGKVQASRRTLHLRSPHAKRRESPSHLCPSCRHSDSRSYKPRDVGRANSECCSNSQSYHGGQ